MRINEIRTEHGNSLSVEAHHLLFHWMGSSLVKQHEPYKTIYGQVCNRFRGDGWRKVTIKKNRESKYIMSWSFVEFCCTKLSKGTINTKQADRTKNTANLHYGKPRVVDNFEGVGEMVFSSCDKYIYRTKSIKSQLKL